MKRLPVSVGILLSGVAFAGIISNVIDSPIGSNEYLHEHLIKPVEFLDRDWIGDTFKLSVQDRQRLSGIVMQSEQLDRTSDSEASVTGQALTVVKETTCQSTTKPCELVFRLGREFQEGQVNKDLRVANVKETSLRVTFNSDPEINSVAIDEFANETRLFRFYQTQNGWMQKTSEILDSTYLNFKDRSGKFDDKFSTDFVGVNYYPASASWKEFWTDFPIEEIKSDLEIISNMGGNSVRIFLTHKYFEDAATQDNAKAKLRLFLDLCAAKNIQVLVTLFDLRPDYTLSNMTRDIDHIDRVLADISANPAILGIDIKNQADLDFPTWGKGVVEGWLTVMARHIKIQYPDVPITVGWSNPNSALGLKNVIDFVTYHEYGDVEGFSDRLDAIKTEAGDKPVMITELGSTIWNPFRSTRAAEVKQASRLQSQLRQSHSADGVFVWTLNDFQHVGSDVVGRRPWRKAQQRHFGLLRSDGSARPSKNVLQAHAENLARQSNN
ncbi:hypothetical protein [Litorimonas sp. WD9-15]|uniref:hypothetical protein n=1 Tax=Litorimonas sp. WD9-15 TaxID=3418716 RepID=UPI003CFD4E2A